MTQNLEKDCMFQFRSISPINVRNLKKTRSQSKLSLKKLSAKRDKWVKEWPGQMTITVSQIQWTSSVEKALQQSRDRGGDKKPMKTLKKKQISFLKKYIDTIRGQLSRNQRAKIVALVTIEVHARDVIDLLIKKGKFHQI